MVADLHAAFGRRQLAFRVLALDVFCFEHLVVADAEDNGDRLVVYRGIVVDDGVRDVLGRRIGGVDAARAGDDPSGLFDRRFAAPILGLRHAEARRFERFRDLVRDARAVRRVVNVDRDRGNLGGLRAVGYARRDHLVGVLVPRKAGLEGERNDFRPDEHGYDHDDGQSGRQRAEEHRLALLHLAPVGGACRIVLTHRLYGSPATPRMHMREPN